jgi:hypothetical protein
MLSPFSIPVLQIQQLPCSNPQRKRKAAEPQQHESHSVSGDPIHRESSLNRVTSGLTVHTFRSLIGQTGGRRGTMGGLHTTASHCLVTASLFCSWGTRGSNESLSLVIVAQVVGASRVSATLILLLGVSLVWVWVWVWAKKLWAIFNYKNQNTIKMIIITPRGPILRLRDNISASQYKATTWTSSVFAVADK